MNLQGLISFAQSLPRGITAESFFSKLEGEFGKHSGALKMLRSMHSKWAEGKSTMPPAQELFESLAKSGTSAKPAAATPAAIAAPKPSAVVPVAKPATVAAIGQSVASRLGLKESPTATRAEFAS